MKMTKREFVNKHSSSSKMPASEANKAKSVRQLKQKLSSQDLGLKVLMLSLFVSYIYAYSCLGLHLPDLLFPYFSLILILVVASAAVWLVLMSGYSFATFGLTNHNRNRSIKEGILFSIFPIIAIILLKLLALTYLPQYANDSLFSPRIIYGEDSGNMSYEIYYLFIIVYILFCPLQELILRGCLQGIIYKALFNLTEKKRLYFAIFTSSIAFGLVHLHISLLFTIATILFGIFLGWMYARHKTLWGVCIAHIIVGVWGLFVVGFHVY